MRGIADHLLDALGYQAALASGIVSVPTQRMRNVLSKTNPQALECLLTAFRKRQPRISRLSMPQDPLSRRITAQLQFVQAEEQFVTARRIVIASILWHVRYSIAYRNGVVGMNMLDISQHLNRVPPEALLSLKQVIAHLEHR